MAAKPAAAPEAAPAPEATPEAPAAAQAPVEPAPPPPSPKELERIAALEAREAKLREAEDRAKASEAQTAQTTKQWEAFVADPVAHILSMRPELSAAEAAQVAERIYFHALGDKAPPEHRLRQEVAKVETRALNEVEQLRAEVQELRDAKARVEQEATLAQIRTGLRTEAAKVTDAPILAGLLQRNPARAEQLLFEVARQAALEAQRAGVADPDVISGTEAAAKLEAYLRAERDEIYGPPPAAVSAPQNGMQSPSTTISNRDAAVQPSRAAPDTLDDKELRKAALKAVAAATGREIPAWD